MRTKIELLQRRHWRIRKRVAGSPERPRLAIHRSGRHLYAQIIDDVKGVTLAFLTTNRKDFKAAGSSKNFANKASAEKLGAELAALAKKAGVEQVVFDRGGFRFGAVVKTLADSARNAGLQF